MLLEILNIGIRPDALKNEFNNIESLEAKKLRIRPDPPQNESLNSESIESKLQRIRMKRPEIEDKKNNQEQKIQGDSTEKKPNNIESP